MFRRFLSLLLVSLLLANQGLGAAHSHRGSDFAESKGHGARPHFHYGGHSHEELVHPSDHSRGDHLEDASGVDKHHASAVRVIASLGEHDSDAVYCGESTLFARNVDSLNVRVEKETASDAILDVVIQSGRLLRPGLLCSQPSSIFDGACPIYLRTLSLRI